jgi:hypothetical protein
MHSPICLPRAHHCSYSFLFRLCRLTFKFAYSVLGKVIFEFPSFKSYMQHSFWVSSHVIDLAFTFFLQLLLFVIHENYTHLTSKHPVLPPPAPPPITSVLGSISAATRSNRTQRAANSTSSAPLRLRRSRRSEAPTNLETRPLPADAAGSFSPTSRLEVLRWSTLAPTGHVLGVGRSGAVYLGR